MRGSVAATRPSAGRATRFWVSLLCCTARRVPWLVRALRPASILVAWVFTPALRASTMGNARGLLGPRSTRRQRARMGRAVVGSFHDFIFELAALADLHPDDARARISRVDGREHHERARQAGRGLIFATAHMGSFEVGMAMLAHVDPRLHVVYLPDEIAPFEKARSRFRAQLGVIECPADGGMAMWSMVAEAVRQGGTVLIQGDRVVGEGPGEIVAFAHGRILVPPGPAKLARLTGAPILPVVSIRELDGRVRIVIGAPIDPPELPEGDHAALQRLADALSEQVMRHPEQWLTLQHAFVDEDREP